MIERVLVYKCSVCGNTTEFPVVGGGCARSMCQMAGKREMAAGEKGKRNMAKGDRGEDIWVGDFKSPMDEDFYSQWVELIEEQKILTNGRDDS